MSLGVVLAAAGAVACQPPARVVTSDVGIEAVIAEPREEVVSLLGDTLPPAQLAPATRRLYEERYAEARHAYERARRDADSIIWVGRRAAYLGRYRRAIAYFSEGIMSHPNDPRMFRHRGHRYITVRELDNAIYDL